MICSVGSGLKERKMTTRSNSCVCTTCGGKCPNQGIDSREGYCIPCDENTYHAGLARTSTRQEKQTKTGNPTKNTRVCFDCGGTAVRKRSRKTPHKSLFICGTCGKSIGPAN